MGGACSLGLKKTQNPVPKHQAHQFQSQYQSKKGNEIHGNQPTNNANSLKDKNSHYNESQKNHPYQNTNPFSTEQNGGVGDICEQIHQQEKIYQIGRFFLESEFNLGEQNKKGFKDWNNYLEDGKKKLKKLKVTQREQIFMKDNEDIFVNNIERFLCVNDTVGNGKKLADFIEKGQLPQSDRWSAWKIKLNVQKHYIKGLYESLLKKESKYLKSIKLDINRAFPEQAFFKVDENMKDTIRSPNLSPPKSMGDERQSIKKGILFSDQGDRKSNYNNKENYEQAQLSPLRLSKKNLDILTQQQLNQSSGGAAMNNNQIPGNGNNIQQAFKGGNENMSNYEGEGEEQAVYKQGKDDKVIKLKHLSSLNQKENLIKAQQDQYNINERFYTQSSSNMAGQLNKQNFLNHRKLKPDNVLGGDNKKFDKNYLEAETKQLNSQGQTSLMNVLQALSIYFPNIGYTQSMNIVVGFFLLVNGGNEPEAFWMFVSLAKSENYLIMGFYENHFPLYHLLKFNFDQILKKMLPRLHKYILYDLEAKYDEWYMQWTLSLFLDKFTLFSAIRFWDYIISQNSILSILQLSLSVLKEYENSIIRQDKDRGEFQMVLDSFKEEKINIDKIISNAKNIKIPKDFIAAESRKYLNSDSSLVSNQKQRQSIYSDYFMTILEQPKEALDTLKKEISKRVINPDQYLTQGDEDQQISEQIKQIKKQNQELVNLQSLQQLNRNEEVNKELSEREVIKITQLPQLDQMSSDIDYQHFKQKHAPDNNQISQNQNKSILPPLKQKKKELMLQPDESNEPAKNKLKTIKNPASKSPEGKLNGKNNGEAQPEMNESKVYLPLIHLQSIQSNEVQSVMRQSLILQPQPQLNAKQQSFKNVRTMSKRHQSFSDVHVMSLDQVDMSDSQNKNEKQITEKKEKKKNLTFLKNILSNQFGEDSTPQSKYYFHSPNKGKKRPQSHYTDTKCKSSHNLVSSIPKGSNIEEQTQSQTNQLTSQNINQSYLLKEKHDINNHSLHLAKQQDEQKYYLNTQNSVVTADRQKNTSLHSANHIYEKPPSKLPSLKLNSERQILQSQLSNFNSSQPPSRQEPLNEIEQQNEESGKQFEHSNSQTQSHKNDNDDDFNIESNVPQKKSLSHQTTNSIPNSSHKANHQQNNTYQLENIEHKLKHLEQNKHSLHSSRPSSQYSSQYERDQRLQKQQAANTPFSNQQNYSTFSTPSVKEKHLQPLSFQKATANINFHSQNTSNFNSTNNYNGLNNYKNLESNSVTSQQDKQMSTPISKNQGQKGNDETPISQNSATQGDLLKQVNPVSSRDKNRIRKFRPQSTTQKSNNQLNDNNRTREMISSNGQLDGLYDEDDEEIGDKNEKINEQDKHKQNTQVENKLKKISNHNNNSIDKSRSDSFNIANQHIKDKQYENQLQQNENQSGNAQSQFQILAQFNKSELQKQQQSIELTQLPTIKQVHSKYENEQNEISNKQKDLKIEFVKEQQSLQNQEQIQLHNQTIHSNVNVEEQQDTYSQNQKNTLQEEALQVSNNQLELKYQETQISNQDTENKRSQISIENEQEEQTPVGSINKNMNQNQIYHKDSLNSNTKNDNANSQAQNSHLQNDMSGYMNEFQQHNYSGYSVNLSQGGNYNFQSIHYQNNQGKEFSAHQIPSPNNSRINDEMRSQESEIGYNNQQQADQQPNINTSIQEQANNEITYSADEQKQTEMRMKYIKHRHDETLQSLREQDLIQAKENTPQNKEYQQKSEILDGQSINKSKGEHLSKINTNIAFQGSNPPSNQTSVTGSNLTQFPIPNQFIYQNQQMTPKKEKNDGTFKVMPTQIPFTSTTNNSNNNSQYQRNFMKSNSLNQLGNQNAQSIHSNSPNQQSGINQNLKYKSAIATPNNHFVFSGNDKINNFVTNHHPYSGYQLQEIQEENYGDNRAKQKNKKSQQMESMSIQVNSNIDHDNNENVQQSNQLNHSTVSSRSNISRRSRQVSATHQNNENQNDILDELSNSQFHSNTSASNIASKPPQPRKSSTTNLNQQQIQILQSQQMQQTQEFTPLRIISSAAQKNLVQGSNSYSLSPSQNASYNNLSEKAKQQKRPSLKNNKGQINHLNSDSSIGNQQFQQQPNEMTIATERISSARKRNNHLTLSGENLKTINSQTDLYYNFSAQKDNFNSQSNVTKQQYDETSNLSASVQSFPVPKNIITMSPTVTHLQQIDQSSENNQQNSNSSSENINTLKKAGQSIFENKVISSIGIKQNIQSNGSLVNFKEESTQQDNNQQTDERLPNFEENRKISTSITTFEQVNEGEKLQNATQSRNQGTSTNSYKQQQKSEITNKNAHQNNITSSNNYIIQ